jgi:AcrR family transcriptional regulator
MGVDVQVSEIVRRPSLAKQTFFRHFPSKDALIVAILVENVNRHTDTARDVLADGGDDLLEQFMSRCAAQIAPVRAIIEHVVLRGIGETLIGDAIARLLSAIADVLTEATSRGEVRDDLSVIDIHILLMSVTSVRPLALPVLVRRAARCAPAIACRRERSVTTVHERWRARDQAAVWRGVDWRIASLIAAAVTVAAGVPSTMRVQHVAGPGAEGGSVPDAGRKAMSPSCGVKAGSTARAIPAAVTRAMIPQLRFSSGASVHTHTGWCSRRGAQASAAGRASGGQDQRCTPAPESRHAGLPERFRPPTTSPKACATASAATIVPPASATRRRRLRTGQ